MDRTHPPHFTYSPIVGGDGGAVGDVEDADFTEGLAFGVESFGVVGGDGAVVGSRR